MKQASCCLAAALAACGFLWSYPCAASRPTMNECFEGSDFIANAARSRDAGITEEKFIGRMEQDFVAIRAFPSELRWFAHDADDEAFLRDAARDVFDHPELPDGHRRAFLEACVERMADPAAAYAQRRGET